MDSSDASELPNGNPNKKINPPKKLIRRGFVQAREPRKGGFFVKDVQSCNISTNKCRMNRLLFIVSILRLFF